MRVFLFRYISIISFYQKLHIFEFKNLVVSNVCVIFATDIDNLKQSIMEQYQVERIKKLMEAKGMTGQQLASICGLSAMTISRILTKPKYNPSIPIIESIAQAF